MCGRKDADGVCVCVCTEIYVKLRIIRRVSEVGRLGQGADVYGKACRETLDQAGRGWRELVGCG